MWIVVIASAFCLTFAAQIQLEKCDAAQFVCSDGGCVKSELRCDGSVDCPDGSDEDFAICWNNKCGDDQFQCTYGACVRGGAACDKVRDCADNSDELLLECRNQTTVTNCLINAISNPLSFNPNFKIDDCNTPEMSCKNGELIGLGQKCDGVVHCKDGSDETLESCATDRCLQQSFKCKYGGCVPAANRCDGIKHCADGSDELEELCHKLHTSLCVIPPYPKNGYMINVIPGQAFETVQFNYSCNYGYKLIGEASSFCVRGRWSHPPPMCTVQCVLNKHPSVEYLCLPTDSDSQEGAKECRELVEEGTAVRPKCREPNYYYPGVLVNMHCVDGVWDRVITCSPQCGLVTSSGDQLIVGGRAAVHGELPWHAGIYTKSTNPYMQICGGSLISSNVVISAAHCFWTSLKKTLPASTFAVAVGKLYRPWNNARDVDAQKSDVQAIKIPPRFQGATANFQEDIAMVVLTQQIRFHTYVRPVCVDFDFNFARRQLVPGAVGKVAGWGLTAADGQSSPILQVVSLPYVDIEQCISSSPPGFVEYITSDKFCAGYNNELDLILTYFCCECSMEVSKQVLDLHYTLRSCDGFAPFFRDRCFDKRVEFTLNTVLFAPLPTPTVLGYRAVYMRLLDADARNFNFPDAARVFMMVFDLWQYEEGTWPGFVIMIDMDTTTLAHIGKLEVMTIKKVLYFVQECMLIKLKEVHFLNAPPFMDRLMLLLRPFLKKSLMDIMYVHTVGADTLDKFVPKEAFPKEEGGSYKGHETIKEETISRLQANGEFFARENRKRVEESLRPGGHSAVPDLFGIQGSFKKLDID